uniref:V-SNARE coiled-coil homology domain-containing protein n=1 Tax=Castor canadensis TaxID=51338 RepID=A0A8C0WMT2_CASCN
MSAGTTAGSSAASGSNRRLQQTQHQVDEVVDIMRVNVDKVLERDQKLSELDDRADALQAGASQFETSAAKLKRKYWWKNCKCGVSLHEEPVTEPATPETSLTFDLAPATSPSLPTVISKMIIFVSSYTVQFLRNVPLFLICTPNSRCGQPCHILHSAFTDLHMGWERLLELQSAVI